MLLSNFSSRIFSILKRLLIKPGPGPWTHTLKTWTRTLKNPGPLKSWTPKNVDLEKYGINMGLKYICSFSELFYKDHAQCGLLFKSSQISKLNFSD